MKRRLKVLTTSEVAEKLGVHPKTISRLIRQGKISAVKLANRWIVEEATFESFGEKYVGKRGRPSGPNFNEGAVR